MSYLREIMAHLNDEAAAGAKAHAPQRLRPREWAKVAAEIQALRTFDLPYTPTDPLIIHGPLGPCEISVET